MVSRLPSVNLTQNERNDHSTQLIQYGRHFSDIHWFFLNKYIQILPYMEGAECVPQLTLYLICDRGWSRSSDAPSCCTSYVQNSSLASSYPVINANNWAQGLIHVMQALYHLTYILSAALHLFFKTTCNATLFKTGSVYLRSLSFHFFPEVSPIRGDWHKCGYIIQASSTRLCVYVSVTGNKRIFLLSGSKGQVCSPNISL